jgi:hypothetical protein
LTAESSSIIDCAYREHTGDAARSAQSRLTVVLDKRPKYLAKEGLNTRAEGKALGLSFKIPARVLAQIIRQGKEPDNKPTLQHSAKSL